MRGLSQDRKLRDLRELCERPLPGLPSSHLSSSLSLRAEGRALRALCVEIPSASSPLPSAISASSALKKSPVPAARFSKNSRLQPAPCPRTIYPVDKQPETGSPSLSTCMADRDFLAGASGRAFRRRQGRQGRQRRQRVRFASVLPPVRVTHPNEWQLRGPSSPSLATDYDDRVQLGYSSRGTIVWQTRFVTSGITSRLSAMVILDVRTGERSRP